jgi:hypothetical protein
MREVVRRGRWVYGEAAYMPVAIVRLDFDFWYEIAREEGTLAPDEQPELNTDGHAYYVCFKSPPDTDPGWVDSIGFESVAAASAWAHTQVPTDIEWFPDPAA